MEKMKPGRRWCGLQNVNTLLIGGTILFLSGCITTGSNLHDDGVPKQDVGGRTPAQTLLMQSCDRDQHSQSCYKLGEISTDSVAKNLYFKKACDIDGHIDACILFGESMKPTDVSAAKSAFGKACQAQHVIKPPLTKAEKIVLLQQHLSRSNEQLKNTAGALAKMGLAAGIDTQESELTVLHAMPEAAYQEMIKGDCKRWAALVKKMETVCSEASMPASSTIVRQSPACQNLMQ